VEVQLEGQVEEQLEIEDRWRSNWKLIINFNMLIG
jgi:hypothetical protein